jgi:acylphosphatase
MTTRSVRRYDVVGRVQGVGFRWFVREHARALDLSGWARNEADGTVVVMASGSIEQHEQLAFHLRQGPPGSAVRSVHIRIVTDDGAATDASGAALADASTYPFVVVRV